MAILVSLSFGTLSYGQNEIPPTRGEWIDMGLPSGNQWYSVNIGASAPSQNGCYFAWGETSIKDRYEGATYLYRGNLDNDGDLSTITKYNLTEDYGPVDNKITLDVSDDVAALVLGTGARIPTEEDWRELMDNTDFKWTKLKGVKGIKLTSRMNGRSLFLPAVAVRNDGAWVETEEQYGYWSSSSALRTAMFFGFTKERTYLEDTYRSSGLAVRAVRVVEN